MDNYSMTRRINYLYDCINMLKDIELPEFAFVYPETGYDNIACISKEVFVSSNHVGIDQLKVINISIPKMDTVKSSFISKDSMIIKGISITEDIMIQKTIRLVMWYNMVSL